jgi:PAS domain S-box-containing protein
LKKTGLDYPADERLTAVLDSISDVYYAIDRNWRLVMFNTAAEQFFGAPRSQILGRNIWEMFPQGRDTLFSRLLEQAMNEGRTGRMTAPSALRAGRTVEVRVAPLGDGGVGVALDDVTERTRAERAMRESQQRLDLAVDAHRIGIFDWDVPSGRAVWSSEMEDIFGIPRGSFEGHTRDFQRRVHPEDRPQLEADTVAAMRDRREIVEHEFRILRPDGSIRWIEGAARLVYGPGGEPERMVGTNIDITERKAADLHQRLLNNELNHRVKNTLAIVQAIAWQSFREAPGAAREAFEGRLVALSAAHDVLTRQNWEAARIGQIIDVASAPHHGGDGRLSAEGPALDLPPKTAVALGLAIHELATNAVKHGALARPEGRVEVRWTVEGGVLRLTWRERGGPPVRAPARRGFGVRMLEHGLAEELHGSVDIAFEPEGLVCRVTAAVCA